MENERRVVAAAKRHPEQFLRLYDYYYPKIYAFVLSRVRHRERAEDIVSNTFLKALDHLDRFTWRRSATFGSWLFRIAKNTMLDQVKKESRVFVEEADVLERTLEVSSDAAASLILQETDEEQRQQVEHVLASLHKLSEIEQEVVSLKYFSGMSYKEIALIVNKKPNTLAVILRRALAKIRKDLDV